MKSATEIDYTRQYQHWHDDSDAHFEQMVSTESAWMQQYLPTDRSMPVLDIGCGMGFFVAALARAGFNEVEGIDADPGQVGKARRRKLPVLHVPIANTSDWMSERQGRYGFISAIDVLEHIPHDGQIEFLAGVHAMLYPGGTLLCRVPNANSSLSGTYRYIDWTHVCSFTEFSLDFVLYNAGFRDIRVEEASPFVWKLSSLVKPRQWLLAFFRGFRRLEMIAEFGGKDGRFVPLTLNIVAVARKPAQ